MGRAAGIDVTAPEMAELWVISELLAEDVDARIPEARWREKMKELDNAGDEGVGLAAGTNGGTENSSSATPSNAALSTAAPSTAAGTDTIVASAGITNAVPNTAATSKDSQVEVSPRGVFRNQLYFNFLLNKTSYSETLLPGSVSATSSSPIPPPAASTAQLPSVVISSTAAETTAVLPPAPVTELPPPRPTTSGKSLDFMNMYQKKVVLKVTRKAEEESDEEDEEQEQEQESGSEWEGEMEVDTPRGSGRSQRKAKKRRRVVSAPIVNSDGEEELPEEPGWPTEPSRRTCDACAEGGWTCRVYQIHNRGRQRYACQMCKHVKKRCSGMPYRRREITKIMLAKRQAARRRRSRAEEEEEAEEGAEEEGQELDEEDEEEEDVAGQRKRQRSRSDTRSNSRRPKKVKFALASGVSGGHQERSQQRSQQRRPDRKPLLSQQNEMDGTVGLQAPNKKGKGKAKRRRDDSYGGNDGMEVDDDPLPMKQEGEDEMEWRSGEYLLNIIFIHFLTRIS
jgi:hypothetical protein